MLYLFTATFPYGNAESFLEDEINYLCQKFPQVTIIPLSGEGMKRRALPANCIVHAPILKSRLHKFLHGLFHYKTFTTYILDFLINKCYIDKVKFREWCASNFNTNCSLKTKKLKTLSLSNKDICYFYWGKGLNPLSLFLKGNAKYVSRFHGEWDLWEETGHGYAPLRKKISNKLSLAVFISEKGEAYFKERYPDCITKVSRLGSKDMLEGFKSSDNILRIVSCSAVYGLKRVPLIFESICQLADTKVEWTHLGDGPDFDKLKKLVLTAPKNIDIKLLGWVSHDEVLSYYQTHPVDVFVNMSTNEGIPVSIMEAISYNIPVVATNVGGNAEIVNDNTGMLISSNPSSIEAAKAIKKVSYTQLQPRNFWRQYYNAETNYSEFANLLYILSQSY